jgi:ABC-type Fe3+-hydroxamate transport system substrate-binding protein
MKKWLVCGSREAPASLSNYVADVLDRIIILEGRPSAICEGEAQGYDNLAKTGAKDRRVNCVGYPADWKKHGKGAGPIRNKQMLDQFQPDIVIAFPGKNGTNDMIRQAKEAGVKVIRIPSPETLGYESTRGNQRSRST